MAKTATARKTPIEVPAGKVKKHTEAAKPAADAKVKRPFQLTKAQRKHVDAEPVISDKMRYLRAEGLERSQIASALGKLYQHVRNVEKGDEEKAARDAAAKAA